MSYYYSYYIGYRDSSGKIYPYGPYDAFGKLYPVIERSRSYASDLHELFYVIPEDSISNELKNSLGYKDKISWETIQNPYLPKGMVISMNQQQQFQAGQLQVLQMLTSIPNNANKNEENQGKQTENRNRKTDGRRNK